MMTKFWSNDRSCNIHSSQRYELKFMKIDKHKIKTNKWTCTSNDDTRVSKKFYCEIKNFFLEIAGFEEIVDLLLRNEANPEIRTKDGETSVDIGKSGTTMCCSQKESYLVVFLKNGTLLDSAIR